MIYIEKDTKEELDETVSSIIKIIDDENQVDINTTIYDKHKQMIQ